jgi:hypothetical protein
MPLYSDPILRNEICGTILKSQYLWTPCQKRLDVACPSGEQCGSTFLVFHDPKILNGYGMNSRALSIVSAFASAKRKAFLSESPRYQLLKG